MIDKFLEVAYGHSKEAEAKARVVKAMEQLPIELLHKIASGEEKLSCSSPGEGSWLDRFKGTPLFEQAVAIEEQELQLEMVRQDRSQEQNVAYKEEEAQRDELRIKKMMLDLELAKAEEGGGDSVEPEMEEGGGEPSGPMSPVTAEAPPDMPPMAEGKMAGVSGKTVAKGLAAAGALAGTAAAGHQVGKKGGRVSQARDLMKGETGTKGSKAQQAVAKAIEKETGRKPEAIIGPQGRVRGYAIKSAEVEERFLKVAAAQGLVKNDTLEHARTKLASGTDYVNLSEMEKEAIIGALKAGLTGAGKFLASSAKKVKGAYQQGGVGGALEKAKMRGATGVRKAGLFAAKEPGAAAALGAGALGAAGLTGAALG